jgi:hypothetical protein
MKLKQGYSIRKIMNPILKELVYIAKSTFQYKPFMIEMKNSYKKIYIKGVSLFFLIYSRISLNFYKNVFS